MARRGSRPGRGRDGGRARPARRALRHARPRLRPARLGAAPYRAAAPLHRRSRPGAALFRLLRRAPLRRAARVGARSRPRRRHHPGVARDRRRPMAARPRALRGRHAARGVRRVRRLARPGAAGRVPVLPRHPRPARRVRPPRGRLRAALLPGLGVRLPGRAALRPRGGAARGARRAGRGGHGADHALHRVPSRPSALRGDQRVRLRHRLRRDRGRDRLVPLPAVPARPGRRTRRPLHLAGAPA